MSAARAMLGIENDSSNLELVRLVQGSNCSSMNIAPETGLSQ
jgi:hypothetical protein